VGLQDLMNLGVADASLLRDLTRRPVSGGLRPLGLHHFLYSIDHRLADRSFSRFVIWLLQQSSDPTLVEPPNDHADGYGMDAKHIGDLSRVACL
jgi:hypothetical protein